jgi:DNA mismatch endonuclease (patch repair protein)
MMRAVRSKGTRLEARVRALLVTAWGIRGLVEHPPLPGKPDFARRTRRATIAVFVDSCYWHGCQLHHRPAKSNAAFWRAKIERNRKRDRQVNRELSRAGFVVVRIWEHELERPKAVVVKLKRALESARAYVR